MANGGSASRRDRAATRAAGSGQCELYDWYLPADPRIPALSPAPGDYEVALVCRGAAFGRRSSPRRRRRLPRAALSLRKPRIKASIPQRHRRVRADERRSAGRYQSYSSHCPEPAARVAAVSRRLAEPPLANVGRSRRADACHVRHLRAGIGSGGAGKAVLSEIGAAGQAWRDLGQLGSGQLDRVRGPQVWGEIPN